jgi:hypothetical protein
MANTSMLVKRFSELAVQFEEVEQTKRRELFLNTAADFVDTTSSLIGTSRCNA